MATAERFVPDTQQFQPVSAPGLTPRASHTATLLTDGRVLVAGGTGDSGQPIAGAQVWDPQSGTVQVLVATPRIGHTAALQPDGTVLLSGGTDAAGTALAFAEVFDPVQARVARVPAVPPQGPTNDPPQLEASFPSANDVDVPTDRMIALRVSQPLRVDTVNDTSVVLSDPSGPIAARVVAAEGGLLVFVTPAVPLAPGTRHTVAINGAENREGVAVPFTTVPFTTAQAAPSVSVSGRGRQGITAAPDSATKGKDADREDAVWQGERRNDKPYSRWQNLAPLQAPPGVTALAGQVLNLNGEPLADVTLAIEGPRAGRRIRTRTDAAGRFLLPRVAAGHHELLIDGRSATHPGRTYGVFEVGVDLLRGETSVLPYTIWMPALDMAHAVNISVPTAGEVVVTTPRLPGLELRIPAGTTITDHEGQVVGR